MIHDQFFLIDKEVSKKLVGAADIKKGEIILEIGAGKGFITKEIAKKAGKVIAVEIDRRFKSDLAKLPGNVKVIFGDVFEVLEKRITFGKIVSNLPSSLAEPLARRFISENFEIMSLLLPLKFFQKLEEPFFSVYYDSVLIEKVSPESFSPAPGTTWAIVKITKKKEPLKQGDWERFLRKYLYEHPTAKLKNALTEAIVRIYNFQGKTYTRNMARKIVIDLGFFREEPVSVSEIPSVSLKVYSSLTA